MLATASLALLAAVVASCAAAASLATAAGPQAAGVGRGHGARRWGVKHKSSCWWNDDAQDLDDAGFRAEFRMEWSAFYALADDLRLDVQRQDTKFRAALDYEAVVAMALYRLATGVARTGRGAHASRLGARGATQLFQEQLAVVAAERARQSRAASGGSRAAQ